MAKARNTVAEVQANIGQAGQTSKEAVNSAAGGENANPTS
jgi:hypothetical protein